MIRTYNRILTALCVLLLPFCMVKATTQGISSSSIVGVQGAASSTNNDIPTFAGTSGNALQDPASCTLTSSIEQCPSAMVFRWSTDAGVSRGGASTVNVGNGTAADASGTLNATILQTPTNVWNINGNSQNAISLYNVGIFAWSSTGSVAGSKDIGLSRGAVGVVDVGNGGQGDHTGFIQSGMTARLTSDFTDSNASGLQVITGLSFALPSLAANWSFHCSLSYSEATPVASDQFGVASLTTSPTNLKAQAHVITTEGATAVQTTGNSGNITNTTPTAIVTFTPVGTGEKPVEIDGTLEAAGGGASTLQFYVTNGTAADVIVIKRGSYCSLTP